MDAMALNELGLTVYGSDGSSQLFERLGIGNHEDAETLGYLSRYGGREINQQRSFNQDPTVHRLQAMATKRSSPYVVELWLQEVHAGKLPKRSPWRVDYHYQPSNLFVENLLRYANHVGKFEEPRVDSANMLADVPQEGPANRVVVHGFLSPIALERGHARAFESSLFSPSEALHSFARSVFY